MRVWITQMVKNLPAVQETRFYPWVGKITWKRKWQPTLVLLPGKSHRWGSLVGYSLWGCKESGTTECPYFHFFFLSSLISDYLLWYISRVVWRLLVYLGNPFKLFGEYIFYKGKILHLFYPSNGFIALCSPRNLGSCSPWFCVSCNSHCNQIVLSEW